MSENGDSSPEINETQNFYNENKRKRKNKNNKNILINYRKYISITLFILIIFILCLLIILFFKLKGTEEDLKTLNGDSTLDINDILPKLKLKDNDFIPTKSQILESRELYMYK